MATNGALSRGDLHLVVSVTTYMALDTWANILEVRGGFCL